MKFLLVRFSAIGDCVMAAHAATSVRRGYPDAFIAWAVESRCAPVVSSDGLVDLRHEFPRDRWRRLAWSPVTWWETLRTYSKLRRYRFDVGVDLQGHSKTALCLYLAKPKRRLASRATDGLARRLNPVASGDPFPKHVVEWNHEVLSQLGDYPVVDRPTMPRLTKERAKVATRLQSPNAKLATISTGAGSLDKQWPIDRWEAVADALGQNGFEVAFLGGPTDPHPASGQDLVGKLPLGQTMAAVAQSAIHLAGDTGTGHIAAAYGVPVVSVFGPTYPVHFRPWTDRGIVLRSGTSTENVQADEVVAAALSLYTAN